MPSAITSRPQRVTQPDHRAIQRHITIGLGTDSQTAVELDDLHRQRVQICQRVVPRTEIVEGDLDTERIEPRDLRGRFGEIHDRYGLGDLHNQLARRDSMPRQRLDAPAASNARLPSRAAPMLT